MIKPISKADWKLFQERLPGWQENYMGRLLEEYIDLLKGSDNPSDRFWKLEKRIKDDKKNPGVYSLGKIYEEGLGVEKDMDKAIEYYKRAILDCEFLSDKGDEHYEKAKARLMELGVEIKETA